MTAQPSTPVHISHHQPTQAEEVFRLLQKLASLLAPTPRTPQTYYVSPTGSDSAACTQSAPCATLAHALSRMVGGDTLYLRAGTYAQRLDASQHPLPSGTSWDSPTTIAAYPGEVATLKPGSGGGVLVISGTGSTVYQYIQIRGLVINASGLSEGVYLSGANAHHLRLDGLEVYSASGQGIQGNCAHCEYLNLHVHHNGSNHLTHGFYVCPTHGLIKGCHLHHNTGYGLQFYDSPNDGCGTGTRIEGNTSHDNCTSGGGCGEMTVSHGQDIVIANNVVYNAGGASGPKNGIEVSYGTLRGIQVLHNTVYNAQGGVVLSDKNQGTLVANNLLYRTSGVDNRGASTTQQANLTSDPLYVDAAQSNFHLQAASPALDAGVAVAGVTTDKDGVARPQGAAPDLGAYERVVTPVPPQPSGAVVCTGELAAIPSTLTLRCVPDTSAARRTP